MRRLLHALYEDRSGATAVEYALIAAMIVATLVAVVGPLSEALLGTYASIAGAFPQP